ncbi:STAS domain-containing protein [Mycolicibacterium boenickei]
MSTTNVATRSSPRPGGSSRAKFDDRWLWPAIAVVSVDGELDASNALELTECGIQHTRPNGQFVLDMSAVEFFGACCFAGLHTLNVECAGQNIDWVLIPSAAVSRVLRICDPAHHLPVAIGFASALAKLRDQPRQLQLVAPGH